MIAGIGRRIGSIGARIGHRGRGGVIVTPSGASLTVQFTDTSGSEAGFLLRYGTDGETFPGEITVGPADGEGSLVVATITGLQLNTLYYIEAYSFWGDETLSLVEGPIAVYTAPSAAPTALVADVTGPSTIDLEWTLPAIEPAGGGYKVYRSSDGVGFTAIAEVASGVSSYSTTGLTDNTGYWFKVTAFNDNGAHPDSESAATNTVNVTTAVETTPPIFTNITVDFTGLVWTMTADEAVTFGAGGNGGFTVHGQGAAITLAYTSGSGSTALVYTGNRAATIAEVLTLDYTQPGNGIEDTSANGNDMATFTGMAVTNNSTAAPAPSFAWGMESTSAETFTSDGSATLTSAVISSEQAHSGTSSLKSTTGFHYAQFDANPNSDWSAIEGTLEIYVRYAAAGGTARIIHLGMSGDVHNIRITLNTTNGEAQLIYTGATTVSTAAAIGFTAGNWHKITAKWRTSGTTPTLSLQRDVATAVTSSSTLPALADSPRYIRAGTYQAGLSTSLYLDDLKIYKAWLP